MLRQFTLSLGLALTIAVEARACGVSPSFAVIHSALPKSLPDGLFVANVEIETESEWEIYENGLRAHVKRMIAGVPVESVILKLPEATSCDKPFANGRSGLVVGIPKEWSGSILIVLPLLVSRYDEFRLPSDFKLETKNFFGPPVSQ